MLMVAGRRCRAPAPAAAVASLLGDYRRITQYEDTEVCKSVNRPICLVKVTGGPPPPLPLPPA